MPIKMVIFDRDGTLIKHVPYLCDPSEVRLLDGVKEGIARLIERGVKLCMHSNQSGVGRGYFGMEDAAACNVRMLELLGAPDAFSEICMAPEVPDQPAVYRKPKPRFAQELMAKYGLTAGEICYVGDRGADIETAHNAGTWAIGVTTGLEDLKEELADGGLSGKYPVVTNFTEAVNLILKWNEQKS